jgi:hypothetical protein
MNDISIMIKFNFIWFCLFSVFLYNCTKEEDSLTYLKAIVNGQKTTLTYIEAKLTRLPVGSSSDSLDILSIYAVRPDYKRDLILDLRTSKLLPKDYQFGIITDSLLVKATYEQDSSFFSTAYDNYLTNAGTLVITKIGNNYIKGLFEFNAALKDHPDSVISITSGSFYAKIK